jgi:hypothetical protein
MVRFFLRDYGDSLLGARGIRGLTLFSHFGKNYSGFLDLLNFGILPILFIIDVSLSFVKTAEN